MPKFLIVTVALFGSVWNATGATPWHMYAVQPEVALKAHLGGTVDTRLSVSLPPGKRSGTIEYLSLQCVVNGWPAVRILHFSISVGADTQGTAIHSFVPTLSRGSDTPSFENSVIATYTLSQPVLFRLNGSSAVKVSIAASNFTESDVVPVCSLSTSGYTDDDSSPAQ